MAVVILLRSVKINGIIIPAGEPFKTENEQNLVEQGYARKLTHEEIKNILGVYVKSAQELFKIDEHPRRPCRLCHSNTWWESIYGKLTCGTCHPPAHQKITR